MQPSKVDPMTELTDKEKEILKLFSLGLLRSEVEEKFNIAPKTLRFYLHRIYNKLGVKKLHQALIWYINEHFHLVDKK